MSGQDRQLPAYTKAIWVKIVDGEGNRVGYTGRFTGENAISHARATANFFERSVITRSDKRNAEYRAPELYGPSNNQYYIIRLNNHEDGLPDSHSDRLEEFERIAAKRKVLENIETMRMETRVKKPQPPVNAASKGDWTLKTGRGGKPASRRGGKDDGGQEKLPGM